MKVSVTKSVLSKEVQHVEISTVYDRIRTGGKVKAIIESLRAGNHDAKKQLPAVMFSGQFTARKDMHLEQHSNRAILDFDKVPDVHEVKNDLKQYPFIEAIFTSPSGNGVKAVAVIDGSRHNEVYDGLMQELAYLNPDTTSRNVARLCFISYDPDIYINPQPEQWDKAAQKETTPVAADHQYSDHFIQQKINTAKRMINEAADGEKHIMLLKASHLLGGLISHGLSYDDAAYALEQEIMGRDIKDERQAVRTIQDGLKNGMKRPLELKRSIKVTNKYEQKHLQVEQTNDAFRPINAYFDEYAKAKQVDKDPLTMGIPLFDEKMRNKYRGKVGAFIGYGGTKKSLFALNMAVANVQRARRIMYSQMEMGVEDMMDRFFNLIKGGEHGQESQRFDQMEKDVPGSLADELKIYQDDNGATHFLHSQQSGLQSADYVTAINQIIETYGNVDMLFIDGLSMMGGNMYEKETERYSRHTKELKEIANTYNIFIGLICHVSRGLTKHHREVSRYVRGSEKILDNVDFVLNFSLVTDDYSQEAPLYSQRKGWIRLWDKRGGGGTHDVIYDFDWRTMKMTQSTDDPEIWAYRPKKNDNSFTI